MYKQEFPYSSSSSSSSSSNEFNILDTIKICNIVVTCDVGVEKLSILPLISENNLMFYNPEKFHTLKNRFPGSTSRLFESGNVVCTGNKSFADVFITCYSISYILRRMGYYAVTDCIRIRNIILGVTAPNQIDIVKLYNFISSAGQNVAYNPAKFSGCIFKSENPKYTITTFASGEMNITGCLDVELMMSMIQFFYKTYIEPCIFDINTHNDSSMSSGYNMFSENTVKKLIDAIKDSEKD
jgi:TATA-box binding protein (TBP) (component of TFIID and TFIIIB)